MAKIKIKQITGGNAEGQVLVTDTSGNNVWQQPVLGAPTDGDFTDPRFSGAKNPAVSLTSSTKIADAVDSINEILGLLLPDSPTAFGGATLSLSSASTSALLASGATNNSSVSPPTAGSSITRVTGSTITTTVIQDRGDGTNGDLEYNRNGTVTETFTFTGNIGDLKSTGVLRVSDNKWTEPAGFYQTFDSQLFEAPIVTGVNIFVINHTVSGSSSTLTVVDDDLTTNPTVSNVVVSEGTKVGVYSSGIEHYAANTTLLVSADTTNLSGQTYRSGTIIGVAGPGTTVNFAAGQGGLANPLAVNTLNFSLTEQTFTIGGNNKTNNGRISVTAYNPNGNSGAIQNSIPLLVLSGTGGINDGTITAPGGSAARLYLSHSSNSTDTPSELTNSAWSSTQNLADSGYTHEATIVGGVLRCDQTNYSTGYLPAGNHNYSGKSSTQYVTYKFSQSGRSSISVAITGSYAGLWVALPGVSDNNTISPNALNSVWWTAGVLYNGSGVPGRIGDTTAGCANGSIASGTTGTVNITFGTQSSSNSTNNDIYIRIKLTAGQSITSLSVS
jgi:hypothetical protein